MTMNKGSLVSNDKKFFATIETPLGSTEVPIFAETIEEALEVAELKYVPSGLDVIRVRPDRLVL